MVAKWLTGGCQVGCSTGCNEVGEIALIIESFVLDTWFMLKVESRENRRKDGRHNVTAEEAYRIANVMYTKAKTVEERKFFEACMSALQLEIKVNDVVSSVLSAENGKGKRKR